MEPYPSLLDPQFQWGQSSSWIHVMQGHVTINGAKHFGTRKFCSVVASAIFWRDEKLLQNSPLVQLCSAGISAQEAARTARRNYISRRGTISRRRSKCQRVVALCNSVFCYRYYWACADPTVESRRGAAPQRWLNHTYLTTVGSFSNFLLPVG